MLLVAGLAGAQTPSMPEGTPRELTESEVTRYIAALRELVTLSDALDTQLGSDPSQAASLETGLSYNEEMRAAIESRGFTLESFQDTHWNTMTAYAAIETEKERAGIEKARKEQQAALAEMKARLPPEQYEQMAQAMNAGMQAMFTSYEQVPPANLALLKKHRQEIAAIVNR